MVSSRWSDQCASPCKAPIRKPARRGSIFTAPPADTTFGDEQSSDGIDSMIYYVQNRWRVNEKDQDKLQRPMRRQSLAKDAQPEVRIPVSDCHTLERQTPWAATA